MKSDADDFIGGGRDYSYTNANAKITVTSTDALLSIQVKGDEIWFGEFLLPDTYNELQPGSYGNLTRYPFHDVTVGGLSWVGDGRGCNDVTGWIIIDKVTYHGTTLTGIDLQFEQHCEGKTPALHGDIHWEWDDPTSPPGPAVLPPPGMWEPPPGVTPTTGNYVYLVSQIGDWVGGGGIYLYTEAVSVISVSAADGHLFVAIKGDEKWTGDFQAMDTMNQLEVGYYGDLQRFPLHNPVKGGMSWTGEGRGCSALTGWFAVDNVIFDGTTLTAIDLRFEQHCDGSAPALYGEIHWDVNDTTIPPGPVAPPPGLWEPAPGITPETVNYVYLESEPGDWVGAGGSYLYTQADSQVTLDSTGAHLDISIDANERWHGRIEGVDIRGRLEVGYYGDLRRYPFHNPARGGLSWSGESRGCNSLTGWFVVDSVTYDGLSLVAIDMRFEQHCEGYDPALYGEIHWDVNDATMPPGPVVPPPGLWEPAPGDTPATGNYVYLESELGDYVGAGGSYLYTQIDSQFDVTPAGAYLEVSIDGDEDWDGDFQGMNILNRLEVGYYGDLRRYPFHNPARGGLSWSGESRGCNRLTGWFVVDSVTYDGTTLTAIDLRFEQHCEGYAPALYGAIHWDASDGTIPPGPIVPPPTGLWAPAPGISPATGNYVYLESELGEYVGAGGSYLYTQADSQFTVSSTGASLNIYLDGDKKWSGEFQGMNILSSLEVGYYGDLQGNPVKGDLSWSGDGRGCSTRTGWFVVDSVTYTGTTLTAIDLRFEQHCEGSALALYGEIHWSL